MTVQHLHQSPLAGLIETQRFARDDPATALLRAATWLGLLLLPTLLLVIGTGSTALFVLAALAGFVVWLRRHRNGLRPLAAEERIAAVGCLLLTATVLLEIAEQGAAYLAVRELDTLLRPLLAIPLMHLMIRTRPPVAVLWGAMGLAAIAAGLNALYAQTTAAHYVLVRGGFWHIHYGTIALAAGFITVLGLAWAGRWRTAYLALALLALALGLTGGFLSGSRGAWTTLPALVVLLAWQQWRPGLRRYAIAGAVAVAVASVAAYAAPGTGVQQRFDKAVTEVERYFEDPARHGNTSIGQRFEMWRAGWAMFLDHPVSGGGVGKRFNDRVRAGVEAGLYHPAIANQDKLHNAYLEALATRGIIGLAGFLAFLGALAWVYARAARSGDATRSALGLAGLMLLAAYMIVGLTDSIFDYGKPAMFFVLYAALIVHLLTATPEPDVGARGPVD